MVIKRNPHIRRGDVYVLNDPYHGGTHLPDITVVTPVFAPRARDDIWFYVASRGHHAEIGGISPGSMPAASTRVEEEGVLIDNWLLVQDARLREAETISCWRPPSTPPAPRPPTWPTCAPRSPPTRRASRSSAPWSSTSAWMSYGPTWATSRRTRPSRSGASSPPCTTATTNTSWTTARKSRSRSRVNRDDRTAEIDFTGTSAQLSRQLQRAVQRGHGGRAVRVPHPGRRRHPAELGLPAAAQRDHPARHHAVAAVPGRRGRGQRGDLPGGHRRAVRRARRDGRGIRDDEQRDVRERAATSTTRRWPAAPARATASTAPTSCRPR